MKKIIYLISTMLLTFMGFTNVKAISSSVNTTSITLGSRVNVVVSAPGEAGYISVTSSNGNILSGGTGKQWIEDKSLSYSFQAKNVGTATITVSGVVSGSDHVDRNYSKSFTVTVKPKPVIVLSKDNSLSSLGIEGKELSPAFSKDTLEYSVELDPDTTKVNVQASPSDSGASVSGAGEREVQDGPNKLEIVVTAENGSTRTYVINATVKEFDPIKVKVDGVEYTVVRKKSGIGTVDGYEATTIKINDTEVPALKSQITGYTLVALKDEKGTQNYFIKDKDKYTLYKEYAFHKVTLVPLPWDKDLIPDNYKKYTITYNDSKIDAYKLNKKSKYALIYGVNAETGVENIYMYDSVENTLQIYNTEETKSLTNDKHLYLKLTLGLGVLAFIELIVLISVLVSNKKRSKVKVKQMNEKVD